MSVEVKIIRKLYDDCAKSGCDETQMFERNRPSEGLNRTVQQKMTATQYLKIMDENYGFCDNPGNPYFKIKKWLQTGKLVNECGTDHDILTNIERV